jgi:class 3 adenylate cyclase
MAACPGCATENPAGARFCNGCGTKFVAVSVPVREERKVVTVLFADLAGFTARSESLDPEDVRAFLLPYYDVLTSEIERHGGHVDRFLGDGVMALFGAPAAHEDDPERAVRAALRILERIPALGLDLHVRLGINTGPVLFAVGIGGHRDDAVTGDAVNTAARLQALAPIDGVVVGEPTFRATAHLFTYETLPPAHVKGKADPLGVWRPTAPIARQVGELRVETTPFVGRDLELSLLVGLFERSRRTPAVELATVVAQPGMGKSRLVRELARRLDALSEVATWRKGRCLPYGDGIGLWALGEIVKSHAGILDSDDPATSATKLDAVLVEPEPARRIWMADRLAPLVGIEPSTPPPAREEAFTAWRGFFESIARAGPTVLVIEDLHWADDTLIAFLLHVAENTAGIPLLLLTTARPEVADRHPGWLSLTRRSTVLSLANLSDPAMRTLVGGALPGASPELVATILERAAGSPLYAEQLAAVVRDGPPLAGGTLDEAAIPASMAALLAARIDALSPDAKALLLDASVVGKTFWSGAVAALEGRARSAVEPVLDELARRELVRPVFPSTIAGEAEYTFWHALLRDVAYGELTRTARLGAHRTLAAWLEMRSGDGAGESAEIIAHHYVTALNLAREVGDTKQAAELEEPALRFLILGGERSINLDVATARSLLRSALALVQAGHPRRPQVLTLLADAERLSGSVAAAVQAYEEAVAAHMALGDQAAADETILKLVRATNDTGDESRSEELVDQVIARLEVQGASPQLAMAYTAKQLYDRNDRSWVDRALAISERLHLASVGSRALGARGLSRALAGDPAGIDDLRAALASALQQQDTALANMHYINLTWALCGEDPSAAVGVAEEGISFASSRGVSLPLARAVRLWPLLPLGRWDEIVSESGELVRLAEPLGHRWMVGYAAGPLAVVLTRRGCVEEAAELARTASSETTSTFFDLPRIVGHRTRGERRNAIRLLERVASAAVEESIGSQNYAYCDLAREAVALQRSDLVERLLTTPPGDLAAIRHTRTTWSAIAAEANGLGDEALGLYLDAECGWAEFGDPYERAHALLGAGRCLVALGRPFEAMAPLTKALAIFRGLGASAALAEAGAVRGEAIAHGASPLRMPRQTGLRDPR